MTASPVTACYLVPGQAHILLAKERSPAWNSLYQNYAKIKQELENSQPDLIIYYSTQWLSVLGYMIQADPHLQGSHVDPNWYEYGTMKYKFNVDTSFAQAAHETLQHLGHSSKQINYKGFPIDTGTIVAQSLLNPENRFPVSMISCNIYSDKKENLSIGQALRQALQKQNKKAAVVLISNLSNQFFPQEIDPHTDHIFSKTDDQWNQKILEKLKAGAIADLVDELETSNGQANLDMGFKGLWWLAGLGGINNRYAGQIFDYQAVWGSGAALVGLYPQTQLENDIATQKDPLNMTKTSINYISTRAPIAVGPYPHARREGDLLFLSGIGPREKGSTAIPGLNLDVNGNILSHDIVIQTHSVFRNIKYILEDCGSSLDQVIDCQVFLTHMKEDFAKFNEVYKEYFNAESGPTRTTIEVKSLPTPIAIELKVIAKITT